MQRYIFEVRDVHNLGGTPSNLAIRDSSGAVVGSFDLPAGNSRIVADLPPGGYSIEATSGTRPQGSPHSGGDNLDNFRVEMFAAGPSPAASGGAAGPSPGGP